MIGYIFSGIQEVLSMAVPCLMDRSPLNVLEWYILWKLLDKYQNLYGNTDPEKTDCSAFLLEFDRVISCLKNSYFYMEMRRWLDVIAIVNSDTVKCDNKRRLRNEGSDQERSEWLYYTYFLNRMYKILYNYIDLVWFENIDYDVVDVISASIREHLKDKLPIKPVHFMKFKYPNTVVSTDGIDLVLQNFHTHIHRDLGRINVSGILNDFQHSNDRQLNIFLPVQDLEPDGQTEYHNPEETIKYDCATLKITEFNNNDESEYDMLFSMCN